MSRNIFECESSGRESLRWWRDAVDKLELLPEGTRTILHFINNAEVSYLHSERIDCIPGALRIFVKLHIDFGAESLCINSSYLVLERGCSWDRAATAIESNYSPVLNHRHTLDLLRCEIAVVNNQQHLLAAASPFANLSIVSAGSHTTSLSSFVGVRDSVLGVIAKQLRLPDDISWSWCIRYILAITLSFAPIDLSMCNPFEGPLCNVAMIASRMIPTDQRIDEEEILWTSLMRRTLRFRLHH